MESAIGFLLRRIVGILSVGRKKCFSKYYYMFLFVSLCKF